MNKKLTKNNVVKGIESKEPKEIKYYGLVYKNKDVPNEHPIINYNLYSTPELAIEAAVEWAKSKESSNIEVVRKCPALYQYCDEVKHKTFYGPFNCIIQIKEYRFIK